MRTRKTISGLTCLTILAACITAFVFAGCDAFGFKVDEKNFPDEEFRSYILKYYDHNDDKYIAADQIDFVTGFTLTGCDNLQGIERFTNVKSLSLTDCKDLSAIESATSLTQLHLTDCKNVTLDFRKFPNLTSLVITNSEISVDIDLSDFAKIKEIEIADSSINNLTLNNCEILFHVYIHGSSANKIVIGNCPVLNSFTADEVRNLNSIAIDDCPKMCGAYVIDCPELTGLAFRKCTSLTFINLFRCGVTEVDLRGCQYIWEVFNAPDALVVTDSKVRPENVIYCCNTQKRKTTGLPDIRIECPPDVTFITR